MIFQGPPEKLVRIRPRKRLRPLPKLLRFDKEGHYETSDPLLIKIMKGRYKQAFLYNCKHCDYQTYKKTDLMAHYKYDCEGKE